MGGIPLTAQMRRSASADLRLYDSVRPCFRLYCPMSAKVVVVVVLWTLHV